MPSLKLSNVPLHSLLTYSTIADEGIPSPFIGYIAYIDSIILPGNIGDGDGSGRRDEHWPPPLV